MKKKWTIATVLLLAVALLAVGTWAYFSAVGTADNVITMGSVKLALHDEDGNGNPFTTVRVMPGSVVNKVVYVENVGTGAFYTRVKITPEIVNAANESVPLDPSEHLLVLDLNDTDWIAGADGYHYNNSTRPLRLDRRSGRVLLLQGCGRSEDGHDAVVQPRHVQHQNGQRIPEFHGAHLCNGGGRADGEP